MALAKDKALIVYWFCTVRYILASSSSARWSFCAAVLNRTLMEAATDGGTATRRLHQYRPTDAVECLDLMQTAQPQSTRRRTHVVFFGDSRIRQQFLQFQQVCCDVLDSFPLIRKRKKRFTTILFNQVIAR